MVAHADPYRRRPASTRLGQVLNLVDGSAAGVVVELPDRLVGQLAVVAESLERDPTALTGALSMLVSTLSEAVSGYAGLRLTLVHTGHPVRLTALLPPAAGRPAVTSLRMPLPDLPEAVEDAGRLVLWSTVPGALVDLAADVGYVLQRSGRSAAPGSAPGVLLDVDLPAPVTGSGVDGLDELATIHRAAGLLIARGHEPGSVLASLRRQAAEGGLSTLAWAERLLRLR